MKHIAAQILIILTALFLTACGGSGGGSGGGTTTPEREIVDSDGDGVADAQDAFPQDASETKDTDLDGVGDNTDAFPDDPTESADTDADGVGDNTDIFPADAAESADTDLDGIGDNADAFPQNPAESVDSDADGVGDNADQFPMDAGETVDSDLDGVGDNKDAFPADAAEWDDSDGDGFGDNYDELPLDAADIADMDLDGLADRFDLDSDADGQADTLQNLVWLSNGDTFEPAEFVQLDALGKASNGVKLEGTHDAGWHIQYHVYEDNELDHRLESYIEQGYFNAQFSEDKQRWSIAFPAPNLEGDYRLEMTLYCSFGGSLCDNGTDVQYRKTFYFTVACNNENCSEIIEELPGHQVSNSKLEDWVTDIAVKPDGEIGVLFERVSNAGNALLLSTSKDDGVTWSSPKLSTFNSYGANDLTYNEDGNFAVLYRCDSYCIGVLDGSSWNTVDLMDDSNFHECDKVACDINGFNTARLVEKDGTYTLAYSYFGELYLSKSTSLRSWSKPVKISDTENGIWYVSLLVSSDGTYWLAYPDGYSGSYKILISNDGDTWEEYSELSVFSDFGQGLKLLEGQGMVKISDSGTNNIRIYTLTGEGVGESHYIEHGLDVDFELTLLGDGSLAGAAAKYVNGQKDVFFKTFSVE
ncbi:hypothetical protein SCD92_07215 [Gilvimarinus sp. SDUM040013]|uniref:Exo-alpha-sialidase n=2 Tax=Gilvimarinus gilvus TaxID=3058038 RepID=A0ABU4RZW7_9GAMM|nr:hypothetical protein [Gilvimarinus sp. SDUM040013]MDX6849143.1 hypothetical protein [Gilvimarinus sp. SDUM040013]